MNQVINIRERMMKGLDATMPDWFIIYANQAELAECVRSCTDGVSGTVAAKHKLRREVCERMFNVLRAGVSAEIVEYDNVVKTKETV